jgi:uncharacterized membrane protein
MISPKVLTSVAAVSLLLCLTGCAGFSSGSKSAQGLSDFSVNISPASANLAKGGNTSVTANIAAQGGFSGTVQLALTGAPTGVTASLSSTSVNSSGNPTISVTASSSATAGTYTITLWAASGSLSHSANFSLAVGNSSGNPDFSISATPASQTVGIGQSTSFSVSVAALNGFTGNVSLTASGLPSGMQAGFVPASISTSGTAILNISTTNSVAAGTYTLTIGGTNGTTSHSTTVSVTVTANAPPPDFSISATPSSQTVTAGNSTSFTVSVAGSNGFTGTVALVESGMSAGMLASCSPTSISGSGSCTLTVSTTNATAAGTYTLTITGTSGSLIHSTSVHVTVQAVAQNPDFTISAAPGSQTVTAGKATTFTATVTAQNGFTGNVALAVTGLPTGVTAGFVPASITASGSSTLTLTSTSSTTAGTYTVTISGTSGSLAHNTTVSLVVTAPGAMMEVVLFPGQQDGADSAAIQQYLMNNPPVSLGATIAIQWSSADNGTGSYDWTLANSQIAPWVAAGHKVNLAIWANSDGSGTGPCGPEGQYGTAGVGNCAIPTYIWNALGSANYVTCTPPNANGPQQMPNYMDSGGIFMTNYKNFIAGVVSKYGSDPNIGYIRIGLGRGGETIPVADWDNTSEACGQSYVNTWGYSVSSWDSNYIGPMLQYEGSLMSTNHLPVGKLLVGITPMGNNSRNQNADFAANTAAPLGIAFGSQGLQESDIQNYPSCGADWCNLFATYTGQVPLELQTVAQTCLPGASCTPAEQATGPLTDLIPFAVSNHVTIIELYYQDWLTAFDPNYTPYDSSGGYATVIKNAAGQ